MCALRRALWAVLLAASLAPAQFRNLATTADGSRLFFISSLRQTGTGQHLYGKVFALDSADVSLVLQPPAPGVDPLTQYTLDRLQAAADGSWVVYGKLRKCLAGSSCFLNEQHSSTLHPLAGPEEILAGNARLSSDGRWAYFYSSRNVISPGSTVVDRQTGASTALMSTLWAHSESSVARNGSVLIPPLGNLLLWDKGNTRTLAGPAAAAVMDDAGTTVVYESGTLRVIDRGGGTSADIESGKQLRVIDLATGKNWPLGAFERENTAPQISADGRFVAYLSGGYNGPQVFFSAPDNSGWKQLTDEDGGVREFALSGDGRVVWALSASGAILRIDTTTGLTETRIEPTPRITSITPGAPGTAAEIAGNGLAGRELRLGGRTVPILEADAQHIRFQVPWDMPIGDTELTFPPGTFFDNTYLYTIKGAAPAAVPQPGCESGDCLIPIAVHEDWSAAVTGANPARPGEVLHIFATGLGPVDPPVATGAAAPAEPLSRTTTPFEWSWPDGHPEVLYSGLAPGTVGHYQVDIRAPRNATYSPAELYVNWSSGVPGQALLGYVPVTLGGAP